MTESIRTFIAIKIQLQSKLNETLDELKNKLKGESIKWVERENLHLTLKFLGETHRNQVDKITQLLEESIGIYPGINLKLSGLGYFKTMGQPRVLFVNIVRNDSLTKLFELIGNKLAEIGFEKEKRRFSPHLTLARIKYLNNKKRFYSVIEEFRNSEFQESLVSKIVFYESILTQNGPIYKPLKIIQLN